MKKLYITSKNNISFPIDKEFYSKENKKFILKKKTIIIKDNNKHHYGTLLAKKNLFKIIDCYSCGFAHCYPVPNNKYLESFYKKKYFSINRKKNYFSIQKKDIDWWKIQFSNRLKLFQKFLKKKGSLLDVGCGPGYFVDYASKNGWTCTGIEPSLKAFEFAKKNFKKIKFINNDFFQAIEKIQTKFDVVYSHGVLEHIADPLLFFKKIKKILKPKGLVFTSVANDFNLFQFVANNLYNDSWWIIPPEHINYFNNQSITSLITKSGYKILNVNSSFPIDIFLLMNLNYLKNSKLGKNCHNLRKLYEKNLENNGLEILKDKINYNNFKLGIGRQLEVLSFKR